MYAYLIEATGIFEILGEVVRRYVVGETLPTPSMDTLVWVRSTEELFFRDPPLFGIGGLTSQLRPEARINRRNAYWRMFGLDLPHPIGMGIEGQPWKRDVGETANERFLELWNELLRQVWLGIEHERNTSGANPTDASYIGYLCQAIGQTAADAAPWGHAFARRVRIRHDDELVPPYGRVRHRADRERSPRPPASRVIRRIGSL